jgi:hypothetical protein
VLRLLDVFIDGLRNRASTERPKTKNEAKKQKSRAT